MNVEYVWDRVIVPTDGHRVVETNRDPSFRRCEVPLCRLVPLVKRVAKHPGVRGVVVNGSVHTDWRAELPDGVCTHIGGHNCEAYDVGQFGKRVQPSFRMPTIERPVSDSRRN